MNTVDWKGVKEFVEAVWNRATESGWPVDAFAVGAELFGSNQDVARQTTLRVTRDCKRLYYFNMTAEGAIHGISDSARAFIGQLNTDETTA